MFCKRLSNASNLAKIQGEFWYFGAFLCRKNVDIYVECPHESEPAVCMNDALSTSEVLLFLPAVNYDYTISVQPPTLTTFFHEQEPNM